MKKIYSNLKDKYENLPILWKLTIGTTLIIMIFIIFYNIIQFAVVINWILENKAIYIINLEVVEEIIESLAIVVIISGVFGVIASTIGGLWMSKFLLLNVKKVSNTMKEVSSEGLSHRMPVKKESNDEFDELGRVFNSLMDELEISFNQQKQFIQDASHELRTPLTIIKGHLSLLNRWGKDNPEVLEKSLKASTEEVDRLILLVKSLLELSKLENRADDSVEEKVRVREAILDVIENFKILYPQGNFKYIDKNEVNEIRMKLQDFKQIIIVLLDNAVKYSKEDEKRIRIEQYRNKENCIIKVIDTGIGIPKEDIPFILNRFYRVDKSRSSMPGSAGIGLSIAKGIIDKYKGEILIESEENIGTMVKLILPIFK